MQHRHTYQSLGSHLAVTGVVMLVEKTAASTSSCPESFVTPKQLNHSEEVPNFSCEEYTWPVTDLRIGQIGHGLEPHAFGGPVQPFPMTTQC